MGTITGEYLKRFHGLPLIRCRRSASHVGAQLLRAVFLFEANSPEIQFATHIVCADYASGFATALARIETALVRGEFSVHAM